MAQEKDNRFLVRAIMASQFAPPFMFSGVAVALPTMGANLHAGAISLGLVETLFLAGQLAFLLPVGRFADASDKKTLYKFGLLGFAISSLLISVLSSVTVILCLRFLQGVTSAVFAATGPAILADIVPAGKRGKAYGGSIGAIYAGLTLGPIIAGFLISLWGWRAVFQGGAVVLLLGYGLIQFLMPSTWKKPQAKSVHLPSTALVASAVLCLVAGSSLLHEGLLGYGFMVGGLGLAAVFVRLQRYLETPLLNVQGLMRNHPLRNSLLVMLLLYVNAYSLVFMLSIYMQISLGHSARMTGQIIAAGTALMAIMAPVAGHLSDRYRPVIISSCGVACVLVTTLMGLTLHAESSLVFITCMLGIQGVGFALFSSPNMALIMGSVPANKTSMASALGAKARSLGMMSGMLITTIFISLHFGNDAITQHPERFIGTMVSAFSVLSVLTVLALAVSLATRNTRTLPAP